MASDGFTVDLGALGAARDGIGKLAEELSRPAREVPDAEVFGHNRLAETVALFAAQEKRGLARLARDVAAIRDGIAETISTYRKVDADGARRFGSIPT